MGNSYSLLNVLSAIAENKSLLIFQSIAPGNVESGDLLKKTNLSLKQYYSRISPMIEAGLVMRQNKKYCLTSLGKIVYELQTIAQSALDNYWNLRAIDSFDDSEREQEQVIENMIADENLRRLLAKKNLVIVPSWIIEDSLCIHERTEGERNHGNLMVVEDEPDVLLTLKSILVSEGYNVDTFTDSFEALKHFVKLGRPYYDLVILDIRMPGMNGIQLYQKLGRIDEELRIIFVTALDAAEELVSILPNLEPSYIIKKPISAQNFINIINKVVTYPPLKVKNESSETKYLNRT